MKKLTIEFIRESFEVEGYILLDTTYVSSRTKLNYICPKGHRHSIIWSNWQQGQRCYYCIINIKLNIEFVRNSFNAENYVLLSKEYTNCETKLNYKCPKGHKHNISWHEWQQGHRCPFCSRKAKLTIEFIRKSFKKEDYTLLSLKYVNNNTKLNYECSQGHKHNITWNSWSSGHKCPTCHKDNKFDQGNPNWKGGITKLKLPLYNTYFSQISFCEETRRDPNNLDLLQIRCTKCDKWFTPTRDGVVSRIRSLNNFNNGESRFYCSDECKHTCSIFGKVKYSVEEKRSKTNYNFTSEELNTWSKEVLKRSNYICEYCSSKAEHAHHIQPKKLEPFFALDPDNGIACCESCHYKYGHKDECSTGVLANIICS